jgi:hypothetical protein
MKLTDEQIQEAQDCKGRCETCSIKQLRKEMPCFDFIVMELIEERNSHEK